MFRFNGLTTIHLRLVTDQFLVLLEAVIKNPPQNPYTVSDSEFSESGFPKSDNSDSENPPIPLTETTTETTKRNAEQSPAIPSRRFQAVRDGVVEHDRDATKQLQRCGFIKIVEPNTLQKSMHFTLEYIILDPGQRSVPS
jgi:hypothetical protein